MGDVSNQGQSLNWFMEDPKQTYSQVKILYKLLYLLNLRLGVTLLLEKKGITRQVFLFGPCFG